MTDDSSAAKSCPYCAGEIRAAARRCRHCRRFLPAFRPYAWVLLAGLLLMVGLPLVLLRREAQAKEARIRHDRALKESQAAEAQRFKKLEEQLGAWYEAFRQQSLETVDEMGRVDAATETGVNLIRYTELVGTVNFRVRRYRERYSGSVASEFPAYESILKAMESYVTAGECWRAKNQLYDMASLEAEYESQLQQCWKTASAELKKARQAFVLPAGLEPWREPTWFRRVLSEVVSVPSDVEFLGSRQSQLMQRMRSDRQGCDQNFRDIQLALELWSHEHDGRYPEALTELVPKFLDAPPSCPSGGEYSYAGTNQKGPPDFFVMECSRHPRSLPPHIQDLVKQLGLGDERP